MFKDAVSVQLCTVPGTAAPDPCTSSRTSIAGGDVRVVVLTTTASVWLFGVVDGSGPACTGAAECDDGNPCTDDRCDAGGCLNPPMNDGAWCDDGSACTSGDTCVNGTCGGGTEIVCNPCQRCNAISGSCEVRLATSCVPAPSSQFSLSDKSPDTSDKMSWKWTRDGIPFGDFGLPNALTDHTFCAYGTASPSAPTLLMSARIPGGEVCKGRACWKVLGNDKGYSYRDSELTPDGVSKLILKAGSAPAASLKLGAKGEHLSLPGADLPLPVTVQLQSDGGKCWESTYTTAQANSGGLFRAKAP